jgi:dihydrofolate synthase/folylpolyglutamate synthase
MSRIRTYPELVAHLFSVNRFGGCRLGLHNIQRLNELLGSPDRAFASIHVAGTNGKGSVTSKLAKALELSGHRVGCYTSPHLSSFRERIQVNGVLISEEEVCEHLSTILDIAQTHNIPATFFELTTAIAFLHFARCGVAVAVLETGLGGRFDATNCVMPLLSVITSIALDHTDLLGPTREQIAYEKGGIIKPRVPVVIGPHADLPIIRTLAEESRSPVIAVSWEQGLDFDGENSAIAREGLRTLQPYLAIQPAAIEAGVQVRPPCRLESVPRSITQRASFRTVPDEIILDVGHNPDAMVRLLEALDRHYPHRRYHLVCGFSKGKDVLSCLQILRTRASTLTLVCADHVRALPLPALAPLALEAGFDPANLITCDQPIARALETGCQVAADRGEVMVVCGSFFIMAEVRAALGFVEPVDVLNLNECLGREVKMGSEDWK